MENTLYRRPLPEGAIPFSSPEGRAVFAEALGQGGLDGYFPLAEQFHTQSDPAFCGLGSLVVALNALAIDPGRLWKGPWRWFAEELLDCCVPLEHVRARGLSLDELACLARCNGADVELQRGDARADSLTSFRGALERSASASCVLIASYDRSALSQTGSGHFSPIGGYHRARDLALVLDVARFKYPPHWIEAERLWRATHAADPATGRARGWLLLSPRAQGVSLGFSLRCEQGGWQPLATRLQGLAAELQGTADVEHIAQALAPLAMHVELREPSAPAHRSALASARAALREHPAYSSIARVVSGDQAEALLLLVCALSESLSAQLGTPENTEAVASELENLRAQLHAVGSLLGVSR
ncbi:MAG TPA: phytochelatin synthase family protein [Polyangiales bacterium]|nr:phytochelatin synthase family protein [Polyangiales bacterium]